MTALLIFKTAVIISVSLMALAALWVFWWAVKELIEVYRSGNPRRDK